LKKDRIQTWLANAALILLAAWILFPLFWLFVSSLKDNVSIFDFPPTILFTPSFAAYSFETLSEWAGFFFNSTVVSVGSTFLSLLIGIPGAYSLARFSIPRKNLNAITILSIRIIPPIVTLVPFFLMFYFLGLADTYLGLILVYAMFDLPYVIWINRGFMESLPKEAEEAAQLDGCNVLQVLTRIVLPMCKAGLAVTAVFCFVQSWNDFPLAFALTATHARTIPVALASLIGVRLVLWNQIFAIGVLNIVPAIILAMLVRKYWVRGLTLGMVKG